MRVIARIAGVASLVAFACFIANIAAGALFRAAFLSDVNEMLLLFAASVLFVILILVRERLANRNGPAPRG